MNIVTVKCPQCQNSVSIKNFEGLDSLKIKCPHCATPFTIRFRKRPIKMDDKPAPAQPEPKTKPTMAEDKTETRFDTLPSSGKPVLICNGEKFPLKEGRNTVGRKSPTSNATLQLPIQDQYMSRVNAIIEVNRIFQDRSYVTISSCNEHNLASVNGHDVQIGDRMVLQPSYVIRLGHTNLSYELEP